MAEQHEILFDDPKHERFKRPPKLTSTLRVAKMPRHWEKDDCLTIAQWKLLVATVEKFTGHAHQKDREFIFHHCPSGLTRRNINMRTIAEALETIKRRNQDATI